MSCQIVIYNTNSFFLPGNTIEGKVICIFDKTKDIKGIKVKIRGKERTRWTERRGNRNVTFSGKNTFLWHQINFVGEGPIGPGTYEYPFQFVLPKSCPSNFKCLYGMVWYYLQATVDISWAQDYDYKVDFTVVAPIDLNIVPNVNLFPLHYQSEKVLCCGFCASKPISVDVYLEREAYIMGETIRFKVHVSNMSNTAIDALNIQLLMVTTLLAIHPRRKTKTVEQRITALYETGVGPNATRDYDLSLVIPSDYVIPNFSICALFQQLYVVHVRAEISGHIDLHVPALINLGHVPLRAEGSTVFVHAENFVEPTGSSHPYPSSSVYTLPDQFSTPVNNQDLPGVHVSMPQPSDEKSNSVYSSTSSYRQELVANGNSMDGAPSMNENDVKKPLEDERVEAGPSNQTISNKPFTDLQDDAIEKTLHL